MDDINIFICTHTNVPECPTNNSYKIVCNTITNNNLEHIIEENVSDSLYKKQFAYAEWSRIYWIWKHYNYMDKKYIGFCQYRKQWEFGNNIPDLDKIFEEHDIICINPVETALTGGRNNFESFQGYTDVTHLIYAGSLLHNLYNNANVDYYFNDMLFDNSLIPYNMFIMKSEEFDNYCRFINSVMTLFDRVYEFDDDEDVHFFVKKYWNNFEQNSLITTPKLLKHARIQGHIIERLTHVWIKMNYSNPYYVNAKITAPDRYI